MNEHAEMPPRLLELVSEIVKYIDEADRQKGQKREADIKEGA